MTTTRNSQRGVPKQWGGSGSGPAGDRPRPRGHIGLIVAGLLAAGFLLGVRPVFVALVTARVPVGSFFSSSPPPPPPGRGAPPPPAPLVVFPPGGGGQSSLDSRRGSP